MCLGFLELNRNRNRNRKKLRFLGEMSSCLRLEVKSPSAASSSTLSESSNSQSQLAISSTRKPRTPRKRPNERYNEAAALLSSACPSVFSGQHLLTTKLTRPLSLWEDPLLLLPFRLFHHSGFPIHHDKPCFQRRPHPKLTPGKMDSQASLPTDTCDFDTQSILDQEIEEGVIDSIMGINTSTSASATDSEQWVGSPLGLGVRPLRPLDDPTNWSIVDVLHISPTFFNNNKNQRSTKQSTGSEQISKPLLLKLNYEGVVDAWSDRGSPFTVTQSHASLRSSLRRKSKSKKFSD